MNYKILDTTIKIYRQKYDDLKTGKLLIISVTGLIKDVLPLPPVVNLYTVE